MCTWAMVWSWTTSNKGHRSCTENGEGESLPFSFASERKPAYRTMKTNPILEKSGRDIREL